MHVLTGCLSIRRKTKDETIRSFLIPFMFTSIYLPLLFLSAHLHLTLLARYSLFFLTSTAPSISPSLFFSSGSNLLAIYLQG